MSLKLVKDDVKQLNTNIVSLESANQIQYENDEANKENLLRELIKSTLKSISDNSLRSVAFSLKDIKGFPRSYGLKLLIDEVKESKLDDGTDIYISTLDEKTLTYEDRTFEDIHVLPSMAMSQPQPQSQPKDSSFKLGKLFGGKTAKRSKGFAPSVKEDVQVEAVCFSSALEYEEEADEYDAEIDESALDERVKHITDPFGVYLLYLADRKGITLTQLENTAWVSKHVVHDINKKPESYKPSKRTAFQLCVGLELSLDDTRDLLMRAGYAISTSVLEDRIWEFFIENEHYDIIDISDSLEKYDLKPIIEF